MQWYQLDVLQKWQPEVGIAVSQRPHQEVHSRLNKLSEPTEPCAIAIRSRGDEGRFSSRFLQILNLAGQGNFSQFIPFAQGNIGSWKTME